MPNCDRAACPHRRAARATHRLAATTIGFVALAATSGVLLESADAALFTLAGLGGLALFPALRPSRAREGGGEAELDESHLLGDADALARGVTTVDGERLARHEARVVGREEERGRGDLLRLPEST